MQHKCHAYPDCPTDHRQCEALRKELADKSASVRSQRESQCDLRLKTFLGQGLTVAMLAALAALGLSLAFTRLLAGMLYGVTPRDPYTLTAVVLLTLVVAAIASLIPAIRAALIEPMQVLRDE